MTDRTILQHALVGVIVVSELLYSLLFVSETAGPILLQVGVVTALSLFGFVALRGQSPRVRGQGRAALALAVAGLVAFFVYAFFNSGPAAVILALIVGPVRLAQVVAIAWLLLLGRRDRGTVQSSPSAY
ncbi:MAG: hypothetical protein AAGE52_07725 [Myxococcota bacterium]